MCERGGRERRKPPSEIDPIYPVKIIAEYHISGKPPLVRLDFVPPGP